MAVASYLLATGLSEARSLFDVSNFSISQLARLSFRTPFLIRASFTFCKGELEGKKEGSCKLYPAAPPFSQMNGYCCLRCAPCSPLPDVRPQFFL